MHGTLLRQSLFPTGDSGGNLRSGMFLSSNSGPHLGRSKLPTKNAPIQSQQEVLVEQEHGPAEDQISFDSVQRLRQNESQRSRLALNSRLSSPKGLGGSARSQASREAEGTGANVQPSSYRSLGLGQQAVPGGNFRLGSNTATPDRPLHAAETSKHRAFSQSKPGKSLRQRLDFGALVFLRIHPTSDSHRP